MRRRIPAQIAHLVDASGLRNITQRVAQWGIFTVSVARRLPA